VSVLRFEVRDGFGVVRIFEPVPVVHQFYAVVRGGDWFTRGFWRDKSHSLHYRYLDAHEVFEYAHSEKQHKCGRYNPQQRVYFACATLPGADDHVGNDARSDTVDDRIGEWHQSECEESR